MVTLLENIKFFIEDHPIFFTYVKRGVLIAFVIAFVTRYAIDHIFFKHTMEDGLYVLIYLPLIPAAVLLGAAAGISVLLTKTSHLLFAGIVCLIAGSIVTIFFGQYAFVSPKIYSWEASGYFLPAAFGLPLIIVGIYLVGVYFIKTTSWR